MKISTLVKKVKRNYDDYGLQETLKKSVISIVKPLYEHKTYRISKLNLENLNNTLSQDLYESGFTFQILDEYDDVFIKQVEDMAEWLKDSLKSKIAAKDMCLVALDNDKVVGFNLVTYEKINIPLINFNKALKNNQAYADHLAVHKEYRKKGLGYQLIYRTSVELRKKGIKWRYGASLISNKPILKLVKKIGFQEIADVTYFKLLTYKKWSYKRIRH